ncbi:DndE family protein [Salegentibacter maritimus]|uniref:DndE family protein n=1 Tax=Salegentibacter maritimus TaxID=2794347 RepID=UPI0018E4855B|nr:DndE family protein [Salegentibacter maritimus]MBI6115994.1 DndE family protein [Salegentibacter maritimus]
MTKLTNKLNLGTENIIARIALTYSLSQGVKLDPTEMKDSGGKSYSKSVLFGDYSEYYIGLIATHYNFHTSNSDIAKLVKMHIDSGLQLLNTEIKSKDLDGFEFFVEKIHLGKS